MFKAMIFERSSAVWHRFRECHTYLSWTICNSELLFNEPNWKIWLEFLRQGLNRKPLMFSNLHFFILVMEGIRLHILFDLYIVVILQYFLSIRTVSSLVSLFFSRVVSTFHWSTLPNWGVYIFYFFVISGVESDCSLVVVCFLKYLFEFIIQVKSRGFHEFYGWILFSITARFAQNNSNHGSNNSHGFH